MKRKTQSRKVSWKKNAHYRTLFKNSWGESGKYKGIWYMTKAFVAYKTMDFMVNKNAVPKDIRKKINL